MAKNLERITSEKARRYVEKIQSGRTYGELFPLVRNLKTKQDVKEFIGAYISSMSNKIQNDLVKGVSTTSTHRIIYFDSTVTEEAKRLSTDNLSYLANIFEANVNKRRPRYWDRCLSEICAFK